MNVLALDFPPVSHLFEWPDMLFSGTAYAINKTVLIYLAAVAITSAIFLLAGRKTCLLYTSPSPRDKRQSRMPSSA